MWFKLALALGMSVSRAMEEISAVEFAEWCAYYSIDPFDRWRGDFQAAAIQSTLANVNRGKGTKAFTAADFMPDFMGTGPTAAESQAAKDEHMFNAVLAGLADRIVKG